MTENTNLVCHLFVKRSSSTFFHPFLEFYVVFHLEFSILVRQYIIQKAPNFLHLLAYRSIKYAICYIFARASLFTFTSKRPFSHTAWHGRYIVGIFALLCIWIDHHISPLERCHGIVNQLNNSSKTMFRPCKTKFMPTYEIDPFFSQVLKCHIYLSPMVYKTVKNAEKCLQITLFNIHIYFLSVFLKHTNVFC